MEAVTYIDIKELKKLFQGKVRDVYAVEDDKLLLVATDRISAFDVVFKEGIPEKGKILTRISNKWFSLISWFPNHLISGRPEKVLPFLLRYPVLRERCILVKRLKRIDIECVARGYLFGSAWKDYKEKSEVCGVKLPPGLQQADRLPHPIFTPATKATSGHDENISYKMYAEILGDKELAQLIKETSLKIYTWAHEVLWAKGIILSDTKLEFGQDKDGKIYLIDEVLTPDSSRFWSRAHYKPGTSPPNFDKQFIRDYLETLKWGKTPPPPKLPGAVIQKTMERYKAIERVILSL